VIANNRAAINDAERVVGGHLNRWVSGTETPCTEVLQAFDRRRRDLGGKDLVIAQPSLEFLGTVPASHG